MQKDPVPLIPRFDPDDMPIVATFESLPAVGAERLSPQALRERFARPPHWQPEQIDDRFRLDDSDPRAAAVLIPIVAHVSGATVLLTQRTLHLRHHSGQVAFPGGRLESGDRSPDDAALREAHEEVGLDPRCVEIIGRLPEYLTGTGFLVTPVVGLLGASFVAQPDPSEVHDVFEVPLSFLMDPRHHQSRSIRLEALPPKTARAIASASESGAAAGSASPTSSGPSPNSSPRVFFAMPYRVPGESGERFIWGATAAMLRNLYRLLIA